MRLRADDPQRVVIDQRLARLRADLDAARPHRHPAAADRDERPEPEEAETPAGPADPVADPVGAPVGEPGAEVAAPTGQQPPAGAVVPREPGRHAVRRRGGGEVRSRVVELVPEPLRGRAWLGPPQLVVVTLLLVAALAVALVWQARAAATVLDPGVVPSAPVSTGSPGDPAAFALAAPAADAPTPGATPGATPGVSPGSATGEVTVDVAGRVRHPGVVVLPAGSRVVDALAAAGGARPGVDLTPLNLARVLVDGEQVLVGRAASPVVTAPDGVAGGSADALVDLNTATAEQLEALPEVGPVTAQAILDWRAEHGRFTSVQELLEVDGIGPATLDQVSPHVTV